MKIIVFGGTFDPVHNGHIKLARSAKNMLRADKVLLIPAAVSPHKSHTTTASAQDRLEMLRLATANEPDIQISDLEIKRPPPSYTWDTIQSLQKQFPTDDFVLLIGADQLPKLHTWHKIGELLAAVKTAVLPREGTFIEENPPDKSLAPWWPEIKKNVLELSKIDISATDIRQRVAKGLSIHGLVHPDVERYIEERHLYAVV